MNTAQKIISFVGVSALLYVYFFIEVAVPTRVLTLVYKGNLVEYTCSDMREHEQIMLRNKEEILWFDGQTFYDQAPSSSTRARSQVKVTKDVQILKDGDMEDRDKAGLFWVLLIGFLVILLVAAPSDGDYWDECY
tara:strand:+ start:2326 stop:2730 length:405 start_codon:yes stop_codon:yes gene_type:complete